MVIDFSTEIADTFANTNINGNISVNLPTNRSEVTSNKITAGYFQVGEDAIAYEMKESSWMIIKENKEIVKPAP